MKKLKQALRSKPIVRALGDLVGKPVGGWPETQQAYRQLANELPIGSERDYTTDQLVDAALASEAGRYRWRDA